MAQITPEKDQRIHKVYPCGREGAALIPTAFPKACGQMAGGIGPALGGKSVKPCHVLNFALKQRWNTTLSSTSA
jgi:hypothetical protein